MWSTYRHGLNVTKLHCYIVMSFQNVTLSHCNILMSFSDSVDCTGKYDQTEPRQASPRPDSRQGWAR